MCLAVGICAAITSLMLGVIAGHGPVVGVPGCGGAGGRGESIGICICSDGASWDAFSLTGSPLQCLQAERNGTSVLHGKHTLMLRDPKTWHGMTCPCATCFAARCAIKAARVLGVCDAGHFPKGHEKGEGPPSSSSLESRSASLGAGPIRTGTCGAWSLLPPLPPFPGPIRAPWSLTTCCTVFSRSAECRGGPSRCLDDDASLRARALPSPRTIRSRSLLDTMNAAPNPELWGGREGDTSMVREVGSSSTRRR